MDSRFYGRKNYINDMDKLLAKLTLSDVNNAIRKYWQTKNMDITIVTDRTEAQPLAESLRSKAPSPMSYSNSLKASLAKSILEEDEIVANYFMQVNTVKVVDSDKVFRKSDTLEEK
jgi:zinc protease